MKKNLLFSTRLKQLVAVVFLLTANFANAQVPTITSFTPTSGAVGSTVTITGTGFNTTAANNIVYFGNVKAIPSNASSTQLVVNVPAGASLSKITVLNLGINKSVSSSKQFIPTYNGTSTAFTQRIFKKIKLTTSTSPASVSSDSWSNVRHVGCVGDLNNDGKLDLIKVNSSGSSVQVYKNTSTVGDIALSDFSTTSTFTTTASPKDVYLGDINNDGLLDIFVSNGSTTLSILINNSTNNSISFLTKQDITVAASTLVKVADINMDGLPDLITAGRSGSVVNLYKNTMVLPTTTVSFATVTTLSASSIMDIDVSDLNNDGLMDIVSTNGGTNLPVSIFINNTSASSVSFNTGFNLSGGSYVSSVRIADLNNDGKNDIIVGYQSDRIDIFQNNFSSGTISSSSFGSAQTITGATGGNWVWNIDAGDIDGDGMSDISLGDFNGGSALDLIKNNNISGGTITAANFAITRYIDGLSSYGSAMIYDLDADGKSDFVGFSSNLISIGRTRVGEPIDFYPQYNSSLEYNGRWFTDPGVWSYEGGYDANVYTTPLYRLNFDLAGSTSYTIYDNLTISSQMKFYSAPLDIGYYNLTTSGTITGLSSSAYIKTSSSGLYKQSVSTSPILFGIGNTTYNPLTITNNTGSADVFGVNVQSEVRQTLGNWWETTLGYNSIQRLWSITKTTANGGSGVTITFNWNASDTKNGTVNTPALFYYNGGVWTKISSGVTVSGNSLTLTGYTGTLSDTKFAIGDSVVGFAPPPTISSFTPTSAIAGSTITITGTGFTGATAVTVGGTAVTSFTVVSATSITAVVGNSTNGTIQVTTSGGTATSTSSFSFTPSIVKNATLTNFTTCSGTASTAQTFTVSGSNLTANLVVAAYTNLEYSLDGTTYSSTQSLTPTSGTVATTTIYVRMTAASTSLTSGNISLTSNGATTQTVAVSGTVNALPTITLGTVANVTTLATSFNIPYTAVANSPTLYSVSAGTNALSGFTTITNVAFSGATGNLAATIPVNSTTGSYDFNITVKNGTTGCVSATYAKTLTITVPPPAITVSSTALNTITNCKTPRVIADHSAVSTDITLDQNDLVFVNNGMPYLLYKNAADGNYYGTNLYAPGAIFSGVTSTSLNQFLSTYSGVKAVAGNFPGANPQFSFDQTTGIVQSSYTVLPYHENFTVSGAYLTAGLTVTPPTNFQVSTDQTTWIGTTTTPTAITLTPSSGTVATTTVYVRTTPALAAGSYSGTNITMASVGATSVTKAVAATLYAPTAIGTQPLATKNICINASTGNTITVAATGSGLTYQWYSNTSNSNTGGTSLGSTSGAQTPTLTLATSSVGTTYYYCVVSGSCGTVTSSVSAVTISPASVAGTASAAATTLCSGTTTTLSLTGNTGTIQWQSSLNNTTFTDISGATSASYTTSALTKTTYYKANVTSGACTVGTTSAVTVTVPAAPYPYDRAVNFSSTGYLTKATTSSLGLTNFTVEAWIYPTSFNNYAGIIAKQDFQLMTATNGALAFMIERSWSWELRTSATNVLTLNKWQHVAASYNASTKQMKMYVDGVLVDTYTRTQSFVPDFTTANLTVGYNNGTGNGSPSRNFAGNIDEVKVWNTVKTDAEISTNYATQLVGNETALVAYYKFDQGIGSGNNTAITSLTDLTANANHLTLSSMTMNSATNNIVQAGPAILSTPSICLNAIATLTHSHTGGTWSTSDANVISIDPSTGAATANALGTATITYTFTFNGCTFSSTKLFTVLDIPAITTQPVTTAQNVCINGTATALSVTATGAGLTYQWYKNTTSANTGGTAITGATSASYTPLTTTAGDTYYYCIVSGTCSPSVTSNVSGLIKVYPVSVAGTIASSVASICDSGSTTLTLSGATGNIQWQRFDNPVWTDLTGETNTTFTTPTLTQNTIYRAQVTSGPCSSVTTSNFTVTVNASPAAPTATTTVNYCQGATATALSATPTSGYSLQWYTAATGGTASSTAPTPTTSSAASTIYYVSQKQNSSTITTSTSAGTTASYVSGLTFGQTFQVATTSRITSLAIGQIFAYSPVINVKIYNGFGGALLGTADATMTGSGYFNPVFTFANSNIVLNANQTYYFEVTSTNSVSIYLMSVKNNYTSTGVLYQNNVANSALDFDFTLTSTSIANPCESPRTAITVNVDAIPTISGAQNMTVGGSTLQLTGSGTPASSTPWTSSNTAVATISATGEVTAVALGTTTITYTTSGGCTTTTIIKVLDCTQPFGSALNFDGVNDYVVLDNAGTNTSLQFTNTANYTLEGWVKRTTATSSNAVIIAKQNGNVAGNYSLGISSTGVPYLSREYTPWVVNATTSLPLNEWHHIAGVFDGSSLKIYIDGVLSNSVTASGSITPSSVTAIKVAIGAMYTNSSPSNFFNGSIDEARIWNVARTATQIQQAKDSALNGNESGLVAYYNFNQGVAEGNNAAVTSIVNPVNSASNGTLTNFTKTGTTSNFVGSVYNLDISGASSICANTTSQYTHLISGGTWSISSGANATISTSGLLTSAGSENVTLSYTYILNGCSFTATKAVAIVAPSITVQPSTAAQTLCLNATATPLTVTATNVGITYQWYKNTTASTTGGTAITGATSASYTPLTTIAGTLYYYCVVGGTCTPAVTSNVSGAIVVSPASIAGTISGTNAICTGATSTLTLSGSVGTIQWQRYDSPIWTDLTGETNATLTTPTLTQNTTYRATVTSGYCSGASTANYAITVNPIPVISGATTVGAGNTITLTSTTTASTINPWVSSNPAVATVSNTGVVSGLTTGSTTITFTNNNGCTTTTSITVNVGTTLTPVLTSPVSNATGSTTLNFNYTLSEGPLAGSVKLIFTPTAGGSPIIWTMTNTTSAVFSYTVGTNPTLISNVVSGTALGFTTYNVTLVYQDGFGNPAATTTNTNIQTLAPPSISFAQSSYTGLVNVAMTTIVSTNTGGVISSYSISPALPNGLVFNTTTGSISGTPLVTKVATNYTITALNAAGSDVKIISLMIDADSDADGVPDSVEIQQGTNPNVPGAKDTDRDGVPDYVETQQGTNPTTPGDAIDTDRDGVPDYVETQQGTSPTTPGAKDTDADGVPDYVEVQQGTSPTIPGAKDTDGDGVPDYIEVQQGTSPTTPGNVVIDTDGDGVPDYIEVQQGTSPTTPGARDTDGDGVPDYVEVQQGTNPTTPGAKDTDGDGVPDYVEVQQGTSPTTPGARDTDGDGVPDYIEVQQGTSPTTPGNVVIDTDADGVPDYIEVQQGTSPTTPGARDTDGDGVPDYVEVQQGTSPTTPGARDTDGDGIPDYVETQQGTSPTTPGNVVIDTDADGVPDYIEVQQGTSPTTPGARDTDGDGVPDYVEVQQGTSPTTPGAKDTDADGVPDYVEVQQGTSPTIPGAKDTDGDGVPDYIEVQQGTSPTTPGNVVIDTDGDGVPDYIEVQQGTSPTTPGARDTDGDGVPDYVEVQQGTNPTTPGARDTDGDGVPDYVEVQQGTSPTTPGARDTDGDGVPDYIEVQQGTSPTTPGNVVIDTDADGVPDYIEVQQGTSPTTPGARDTDGDGVPDYVETQQGTSLTTPGARDTDGDGIPDYVETQQGTSPTTPGNVVIDTDADGVPDYIEVQQGTSPTTPGARDTDGDGVPDYVETQQGTSPTTPGAKDTDADGVPDYVEVQQGTSPTIPGAKDTDGDGVPDYIEVQQGTSPTTPGNVVIDTDGDGVPDYIEVQQGTSPTTPGARDTDGDGVPDYVEVQQGTSPTTPGAKDTDGDGVPDYVEVQQGTSPTTPGARDTDGDGVPDYIEVQQGTSPTTPGDKLLDNDGDGVPNYVEVQQGTNPRIPGARDTDGDGVPDYVEVQQGTSPTTPGARDTDGDGVPDYIEVQQGTSPTIPGAKDTDGDGVPDYIEIQLGNNPAISDAPDADSDGISNYKEGYNFRNPGASRDTDRDGIPDYLDVDSDGDSILDRNDAFPLNRLEWADTDRDGIGNNADTDDDNDGILDACDVDSNGDGIPDNGTDMDADGIIDSCDSDKDGDGVNNTSDNCPNSANTNQADRDSDGAGDVCDAIELDVTQALTPNGDGINDTWVIYNLGNHPASTVRVFNANGMQVFYSANYQNNWTGNYQGSSEMLPVGSYMYQIDLGGDGTIDSQGWLYITK